MEHVRKRKPKKKLSQIPPERWLPQALETLDLVEDQLYPALTSGAWADKSPQEMRTAMGNIAARHIIESLKNLRRKSLHQLYREVCRTDVGVTNKTYVIKHLCYKISAALGLMNPRMRRNYRELQSVEPEKLIDIYGGAWRTEAHKRYLARKRKEAGLPESKSRAERGPTITSTIVECLQRAGSKGTTKEEVIKAVRKALPERNPVKTARTVGVQLTYHLPKKYAQMIRRGNRFFLE